MLGAIIGDIVGSRFEFNNTFDYNFELFHKDCDFTDDTICTVAIADAILQHKDNMPDDRDFRLSLQYWCQKYPNPMGAYGGSFNNWVHSSNPQPYNSWGNGAAMRVSPIGLAFNDPHTIVREAMNSAKVSHDHVEGLIGASAVAMAMYEAKIFPTAKKAKPYISSIARWYYGDDFKKNLPRQGVFDETCKGCVPLALYIILESDDFEDAIRKAISYGGDSDTLGAIVGSIAEPLYGVPHDMEVKALEYLTPQMLEVYNKFKDKYGKN